MICKLFILLCMWVFVVDVVLSAAFSQEHAHGLAKILASSGTIYGHTAI